MDDPDVMDEMERQDFYACQWNHPEPDENQALSFEGRNDECLSSDSGSF